MCKTVTLDFFFIFLFIFLVHSISSQNFHLCRLLHACVNLLSIRIHMNNEHAKKINQKKNNMQKIREKEKYLNINNIY